MLLIASASSFSPGTEGAPDLLDLPRIIYEGLGFQGIALHTSHLTGWDASQLDRLRDQADKVACPCLVLVERASLALGESDDEARGAARDRAERILRVGHRLGCSSVAMSITDPGGDVASEHLAFELKELVGRAERLELNFLIAPSAGSLGAPEQLTALIRRVGGFRIGSYPDFQTAHESGDITSYLRALSPYASAISASVFELDSRNGHKAYDLDACISAIRAVGYDQTLNVEYRGTKDPTKQLERAKQVIESRLQAQESGKATSSS